MLNNLSDREKKLVFVIALVIPLAGIYYGYTIYRDVVKQALVVQNQKKARLTELEDLEFAADFALLKLSSVENASLPTDIYAHKQSSKYVNWLEKLAEDSGMKISTRKQNPPSFAEVKIENPDPDGKKVEVFTKLKYEMAMSGDLRNITKFLHGFYDAGVLHQIDRLVIRRPNGKDNEDEKLTVVANIVALIMPNAVSTKPMDSYPKGKFKHDLAKFDPILRRNLFGLKNVAPEISMSRSLKLKPGDDLSTSVSATDHPFHSPKLKLLDTDIKGAKLVIDKDDPSKAYIKAPSFEKEGSFFVKIAATDDGFPAKTTEKRLVVSVKKPYVRPKRNPEPKKPLPLAPETYITAILNGKDGVWLVILDQRMTGKELRIKIGKDFELDQKKWKFLAVAGKEVTFQVENEKRVYVLGKSLDEPLKTDSIKSGGGIRTASSKKNVKKKSPFAESELTN